VQADRAGTFNALLRDQLPVLREQPGLVYVKLARRFQGRVEEIMLIEEWKDPAALYRWTGPSLAQSRLGPKAEALIDDLRIDHYEALDVEYDEAETGMPQALSNGRQASSP